MRVHPFFGILFISCAYCQMYEYRTITTTMPWREAQRYCRDNYDDLATIRNADDVNKINMPASNVWIGLFDDPLSWRQAMTADSNSWRWSVTGNTSPGGYQNWATNAPKSNGRKTCVYMLSGKWQNFNCGNKIFFACYTVHSGSKNYIVVNTEMSWDTSLAHCRLHYDDLAMIESSAENQALASAVQNQTVPVWIGLNREPWRWSDGSLSTYTRWSSGEPDNLMGTELCVASAPNRLWVDITCSRAMFFICQEEIKLRSSIKIRLQSTADLSNPAIKSQLVQQIEARLGNTGTLKIAQFTLLPNQTNL